MDAVVTARVPVEIKEQGNAKLKSIGATPTELVNAAYRYVLKTGELPRANKHPLAQDGANRSRRLSNQQRSELIASLSAMTLPAASDDTRSFSELLAEARDERYAHLS